MTPDYPSSLSCSFPPLDMKDTDQHHHHHQSQLSVFISGHQANSINTTSNFLPSYTSLLQDQGGSSSTTTGSFIASSSIRTLSGSQGIHLQAPELVGGSISSDDRELTHRNGIDNNMRIPNFKIMKLNGADSITGGSSGESIDILSNKGKQNKDSSYCCSKMMFSGRSNDEISTSSATRMCGDCNTTTTPLWRTGPLGPKSLCNACGIRRRKARRAEEEAVAATTEKKARPYHRNRVFGYRKLDNSTPHKSKVTIHGDSALQEPPIFKNLGIGWVDDIDRSGFRRAFPEDETEAAIMLMELSYGFTHTD